jgi:hypothetical protein
LSLWMQFAALCMLQWLLHPIGNGVCLPLSFALHFCFRSKLDVTANSSGSQMGRSAMVMINLREKDFLTTTLIFATFYVGKRENLIWCFTLKLYRTNLYVSKKSGKRNSHIYFTKAIILVTFEALWIFLAFQCASCLKSAGIPAYIKS